MELLMVLAGIAFVIIVANLKNKKKVITTLISTGALVLLLGIPLITEWCEESNDNPFDYARLTELDYKAVIADEPGSRGKAVITERITFDVRAASRDNLFWELWRALPESLADGVEVRYQVNSVRQIMPDGSVKEYAETTKLYWYDRDYTWAAAIDGYGPEKWFHSIGPYNPGMNRYECLMIYVDGIYRDRVVFEIEYEMTNAALRYGDSSEIYLSLYSEETVKYLESVRGQILIPIDKMPREGNYSAFTYGTNSHQFPFTSSATANPGYYTFSFELGKSDLRFRPYNQYIEFVLLAYGEDKHIFTQYADVNDYYDIPVLEDSRAAQAEYEALPGRFLIAKICVFVVLTALAGLLLWHTLKTDTRIRKKYKFYEPFMDIEYFREIPGDLDPNFVPKLVFCKHKNKDVDFSDGYSATMLSLVRKGYIELDRISVTADWVFSNMLIRVLHTPNDNFCSNCGGNNSEHAQFCTFCATPLRQAPLADGQARRVREPLTPSEDEYYRLILRHTHGVAIALPLFQKRVSADYEYTNTFIAKIRKIVDTIGDSGGFFSHRDYNKARAELRSKSVWFNVLGLAIVIIANLLSYPTRLDFAFGAFFIIGLTFLGCGIYTSIISNRYILLTQFGEDEYAKWRGLYNFLNSDTLINERIVPELVIWEKYLVYATALGISDKVIKALQIKAEEMRLNLNASPVLRNPYYRTMGMRYAGRSFATATRSASTSYSTAHGGGGHSGGYGGGGRGGGGGGGGH